MTSNMQTEQEQKYIPRDQSREEILNESYKNTIGAFLCQNKVYDCLPKNSQIVVIDKNFSCFETINLIIKNNYEEVLIWNSDESNFDGIITYSDIINITLQCYKNVCFTEDKRQIFLQQLQNLTVRSWFRTQNQNEYEDKELIVVYQDAQLEEACSIMVQQKIHRILVKHNESQLIVGVLLFKDILLYLIRNLTQNIEGEQNDIPFSYVVDQIKTNKIISCCFNDTTFDVFDIMIHKLRVSSIPIVDENNMYIALIHIRDIIFIWKTQNFNILSRPIHEFLELLKQQKQRNKLLNFGVKDQFQITDSVRKVVEDMFLAQGNRLVQINNTTKKIERFITLGDIFQYYINHK